MSMKKLFFIIIILFGVFTTAKAITFKAPSNDFVLIKGGTFTMGSPESEDWRSNDEIQHSVTVASFYISKYEVTQKQWHEITGKNRRVYRGGDWNDFGKNLRSAYRAAMQQTSESYNVGLRLVCNADDSVRRIVTTYEATTSKNVFPSIIQAVQVFQRMLKMDRQK